MMVRKQVQLTKRQAAAVRREATRRGISEAAFIREAVERALGQGVDEERKRRALAAIGRFASGFHDIGQEHDRYLEEAYADNVVAPPRGRARTVE